MKLSVLLAVLLAGSASCRLLDVLTGKEKINFALEDRSSEDLAKLTEKGIDGVALVNLVRNVLEGVSTEEEIDNCQLVKLAKKVVVDSFLQNLVDGGLNLKNLSPLMPWNFSPLRKLTDVLKDIGNGLKETAICKACVVSLDLILVGRRIVKLDEDTLRGMLKLICNTLGSALIGEKSCNGLVEMNFDRLLYIVDKREFLGSSLCALMLQNFGCKGKLPKKWNVNINKGNDKQLPEKHSDRNLKPHKVLHITDIHYDPYYAENVTADCKEVMMCCQKHDQLATSAADGSGYWTDYRSCDIPKHFIERAFQTIRRDQKEIDYIYFTGDVISHRAWDIDSDANIRDVHLIMDLFKESFPGVRIFPILGNHEAHPLNVYAPEELNDTQFSMQWLYNLAAEVWKDVLPEGTDLETIRKGGYYTVKEEGRPRIIALNSNVGYTLNYWLIYEDYDYNGQLQWLADTLQRAEDAGETVHILSHIPSGGGDSYSRWAQQFQNIMERYHHIIAGVFCGHTHFDELYVYYKGEEPINIGLNGGSLTPYSDVNPNYRMVAVAADTHEILDYDEYYVNVSRANQAGSIEWKKLYSFKEEYSVPELKPKHLNELVMRMAENATLRNIYQRNKMRLGPAANEKCDNLCHQENLCNIVTNVYSNQDMCKNVKKRYKN